MGGRPERLRRISARTVGGAGPLAAPPHPRASVDRTHRSESDASHPRSTHPSGRGTRNPPGDGRSGAEAFPRSGPRPRAGGSIQDGPTSRRLEASDPTDDSPPWHVAAGADARLEQRAHRAVASAPRRGSGIEAAADEPRPVIQRALRSRHARGQPDQHRGGPRSREELGTVSGCRRDEADELMQRDGARSIPAVPPALASLAVRLGPRHADLKLACTGLHHQRCRPPKSHGGKVNQVASRGIGKVPDAKWICGSQGGDRRPRGVTDGVGANENSRQALGLRLLGWVDRATCPTL